MNRGDVLEPRLLRGVSRARFNPSFPKFHVYQGWATDGELRQGLAARSEVSLDVCRRGGECLDGGHPLGGEHRSTLSLRRDHAPGQVPPAIARFENPGLSGEARPTRRPVGGRPARRGNRSARVSRPRRYGRTGGKGPRRNRGRHDSGQHPRRAEGPPPLSVLQAVPRRLYPQRPVPDAGPPDRRAHGGHAREELLLDDQRAAGGAAVQSGNSGAAEALLRPDAPHGHRHVHQRGDQRPDGPLHLRHAEPGGRHQGAFRETGARAAEDGGVSGRRRGHLLAAPGSLADRRAAGRLSDPLAGQGRQADQPPRHGRDGPAL